MDTFESLSHSVWACKYHVVFIPKGRRKTLYGPLRQHLGEVFRKLATQKESRIEEGHLLRPSPSGATTSSGLLLTAAMGLAGFVITWPIRMATNAMARAIVTRYPIYDYISGSVFWSGVDLLGLLITGVLVALVTPMVRLRPMSAALAIVAVMALVFAVDRPIMMWLFGPPLGAHISLMSSAVRWLRGVSVFGSAILIGAAIGRMSPSRHIPLRARPSAE